MVHSSWVNGVLINGAGGDSSLLSWTMTDYSIHRTQIHTCQDAAGMMLGMVRGLGLTCFL